MFTKSKGNNLVEVSILVIVLICFFYILSIGKSVIIPFIIASLLSFAIIGLSNFYKKLKIHSFISFILSLSTYGFLFFLVGLVISSNTEDFITQAPLYQEKIANIFIEKSEVFFNLLHIEQPENISQIFSSINIANLLESIGGALVSISSRTGIIVFYTIFILLEYRYFTAKLNLIIINESKRKNFLQVVDKIKSDIKSYFVIKFIVSFFVGFLSYIIMIVFDLEFAIFFAFIIFLLNFIPNIGSIIAVSFPVLFSLVQFESFYLTSIFLAFMVGVQILMGNFVEPQFMGNRLNLSPLVIIINLIFWGTLWGVIGMLLSVPIMVIINIILAEIPETRSIAILFSEKGDLEIRAGRTTIKNRQQFIKTIGDKFKLIRNKFKI